MPLTCPRCASPLEPRDVDDAVTVDICSTCRGVWIDGPELMTACRTLAHLPERRGEVELTGHLGRGIAKCPRCDSVPYELRIVGVDVDFCTRCAGAWIDGDERDAIGVEVEPHRARRPGGGAYREVVDQSVAIDAIACASCGERVRFKTTFASPTGFICAACHGAADLADAAARAAGAGVGPHRLRAKALCDALAAVVEKSLAPRAPSRT